MTSNDPLGGCVTRVPLKNTMPLSFSETFHVSPLTFWSTSNSTSIRPLSVLAFSFHVLAAEQSPAS